VFDNCCVVLAVFHTGWAATHGGMPSRAISTLQLKTKSWKIKFKTSIVNKY